MASSLAACARTRLGRSVALTSGFAVRHSKLFGLGPPTITGVCRAPRFSSFPLVAILPSKMASCHPRHDRKCHLYGCSKQNLSNSYWMPSSIQLTEGSCFQTFCSFKHLAAQSQQVSQLTEVFRTSIASVFGAPRCVRVEAVSVVRLVGNRDSMATEPSSSIILIAFVFGLSIFVLVYVLAEASGPNLNPVVSTALLVGKRITVERFIVYVILQVLGAMVGTGLATIFLDSTDGGYNAIADDIDVGDAFAGEVLCTFLLVLTVFAATDGELVNKHAFAGPLVPWVVGMAVLLTHLIMIPIDGCSINPARSFAAAFTNKWDDHWVFWIGPLLGGVLATVVWETILRPDQLVESQKPVVQASTV